jgi:D-alanyl-lipoteichoic acid acyltransferase DltB (MBOAT superfamily)
MGGNRSGRLATARNLVVTMLLGGLWHGAGWTFVLWGGFHALLLLAYLPFKSGPAVSRGAGGAVAGAFQRILLFHFVCLGWMLFRAETLDQFLHLVATVVFDFHPVFDDGTLMFVRQLVFFAAVPLAYQFLQYLKDVPRPILTWPTPARALAYVCLFFLIAIFGYNDAQSFVYFQF